MKKQKKRGAFFLFFSSTNVETKNVCPIAYNVSWLYFSSGKVKNQLSVMPKTYKHTLIFD